MPKVLLPADKGTSFPWKACLFLTAGASALLLAPLRGQDDTGAISPPPDNAAPPAQDMAAPAQDMQSSAPDDANTNGAPADDSASFQTFYDALGNQGTWIQSSDYGYVWQPQVTDPDWAPYTDGSWAYSDDGWTWVSDEPWGWATYHYGRWVNLDGTGWCWVPGYTWAPAWVSWRYGDGYCGWAPLPPDSFLGVDYSDDGFAIGIGFHIGGDCDAFYGIGPWCYNFLPWNCLGRRNYHGYYCHRGDNFAIINHTANVTNINLTRSGAHPGVTTGGPSLAQVNAVSQTPIQKVSLVRSKQPGGGGTLTGNSLALYAPRVNPRAASQPVLVSGLIRQATINHGTDIMAPLAVNSSLTPSPATETQVQQARIAQDHAPAGAKVLTDSAAVRPVLQTPLTSLKPLAGTVTSSRGYNPENEPSTPTAKVYPQTIETGSGGSSRVFNSNPASVYPSQNQPRSTATGTGGGSESRPSERPTAPAYSPPTATVSHQGSGGNSGGNASGGGGGGFHSGGGTGGNSQQSH